MQFERESKFYPDTGISGLSKILMQYERAIRGITNAKVVKVNG
jgi:hypothetical protein